jgi:trk system potassium uptake protein TrkH
MAGLLYFLGILVGILGLAMVFPALVAASLGEGDFAGIFLVSAALNLFVAGGLVSGLHGQGRRLKRVEALVLAILVWTVAPAFAALPLALAGSYETLPNAYFETVSAFTTTGATALGPADTLPRSLVLWRSLLQWIGGGATLLTIVLILAPARIGGTPDSMLVAIETGGRTERARIIGTALRILPLYMALTGACVVLLAIAGVPAFDAVSLSMTTLSTGGLTTHDGGLAIYDSMAVEAIVGLFMFAGATSIIWHRMLFWRRWNALKRHREAYWMAACCAGLGVLFGIGFYLGIDGPSGLDLPNALWKGLITGVSVISTTGIEVREGGFAAISLPLLAAMLMLGGAGFSAAGGVKFFRLGAMLKQGHGEVRRLIYPHGIRSARYGSQFYDMQLMKAIWTSAMAYLGAIATVFMLLALLGHSFEGSLAASVSAIANAGPVYASLAAAKGWIGYAQMPLPDLMLLTAAMIVGRLEVLALFALLNPLYWRS